MCVEDERGRKSTTDKDPQRPKGLSNPLAEAGEGCFGSPSRDTNGWHLSFMSDCLPYTHQYCTIHSGFSPTWHQGAVYYPLQGS